MRPLAIASLLANVDFYLEGDNLSILDLKSAEGSTTRQALRSSRCAVFGMYRWTMLLEPLNAHSQ